MGVTKLKKLKKAYRAAVLSGRTDISDIESELKLEAGNEFGEFVAEVAREKAELESRAEEGRGTDGAAASPQPEAIAEPVAASLPALAAVLEPEPEEGGFPSVPESMCRMHPNDVSALPPSDVWEVCIDESYLGRDTPGVREGDFYGKKGSGLIAGVVFAPANPLPPIAQLHCAPKKNGQPKTAAELRQEEDALDAILNHPACGVLALPARAQEMTLGYTDLLISWTCVLITLLPLPAGEGEVVVRCHVEPRAELQFESDFRAYRLSCERQLREAFPALARRVRLECLPLPKAGTADARTLNPYADIVAHTCQACGRVARKRFDRTKWSGVCYLDAEPEAVERLLHLLFGKEPLGGAAWTTLLKCEKAGFARAMIAHVGERSRHDGAEWRGYLDRVAEHLRSGAIDMRLLRRQVGWLETYLPAESLPKETELVWLTAKLALANHEGRLAPGAMESMRADFDRACAALHDENIGLVCRAVLNLAVAYTNSYEFEIALAVLHAQLEQSPASVGRENYGQLLSSAGQHYAFLGDTRHAVEKFRDAIACFNQLSDPKARIRNIGITSAYLATAVMDGSPAEAIPTLAYYLLGDAHAPVERLAEETARLAKVSSESFADKFRHHIVLRYVVSAGLEDPLRRAYRACWREGAWSEPGEGHPWELVEFYRALLLQPDTPERRARFERAWEIAVREGGDTIMVIAAVIAGAALKERGMDVELWQERLAEACRQVSHIHALWGNGRFQALVDQTPEGGLSALDLARKVLPFNFR